MKCLVATTMVVARSLIQSTKEDILMNLFEIFGPLVLIALITLPLIPVFKKKVDPRSAKFRVMLQISLFFASMIGIVLFTGVTSANEVPVANDPFQGSIAQGMAYIAAALAVSASVIGAGYAVAQAAPAAIGAISEKEDIFGKAMIFVALAEGVAIYGLLIAILIIQKL